MKFPDDVHSLLLRRFQSKHREWLKAYASSNESGAVWPMEINLGIPTEQDALRQPDRVKAWVSAWRSWQDNNVPETSAAGTLLMTERFWRILGTQTVPEKLILNKAEDAISWIGKRDEWSRAVIRYKALAEKWPVLADVLTRHYSFLADSNETDFSRLAGMLKWINTNPDSNLYPRQIPVAGMDSKWLEHNKKLVSELTAVINNPAREQRSILISKVENNTGFFEVCGLKPPPQLLRMRILDPHLRSRTGSLCDITVPLEEAANLDIKPAKVFIVENLQTGLAFEDLPGSVVIMGLGYGVDVLGKFPWLQNTRCIYWGDIDTHGFAILNRARIYLPALESILMDEATLLNHRHLWVEEKKQHPSSELPLLTNSEQRIFYSLKTNVWGQNIRLEQERISWEMAWNVIIAL